MKQGLKHMSSLIFFRTEKTSQIYDNIYHHHYF